MSSASSKSSYINLFSRGLNLEPFEPSVPDIDFNETNVSQSFTSVCVNPVKYTFRCQYLFGGEEILDACRQVNSLGGGAPVAKQTGGLQ